MVILPVGGIVSYEAVGHHDEGEVSTRDVLYGHHSCQPNPPTPGVEENRIEKVENGTENLSSHTNGQERFSM